MKTRHVWAAVIIATMLAARLAPAHAVCSNWSVAFEPDQRQFRPSDVVTGRIRIGCPSGPPGLPGSAFCRQVVFTVVAPGGAVTDLVEHGLYGVEAKMRVFLGRGEEVLRPVCLVKWGGRFVFALPGEYKITAQVLVEDFVEHTKVVLTTPPLAIEVVGTEPPPNEYLSEFDQYSDVCGYFQYALSHHGIEDLAAAHFGAYDESICAFMNYQLWHSGIESQLRPQSMGMSPTLVEIGRANCRARMHCGDCRGSWVLDGLESMRRAGHDGVGAGRPGFAFVAGDIVY